MACEVVGMLVCIVYEHHQALQPFNVEEETVGGGAQRAREESHW